MSASENGLVYTANWWTFDNDPSTNSGAIGTGEPWTVTGKVNTTPTAPNAPTGLTATAASSTDINLSWTASTVAGSGTVSDYAIFENGKQIGTTTNTFYDAGSLTASTAYNFSVEAIDATGASPSSATASATTLAPGVTAGTGTFAPYIDMGLAQDDNLLAISQASGIKTFTLAFIQSSGTNQIGWGGVEPLTSDTLANGTSIQYQVQQLQAAGGNVIISFGGAQGTDPAAVATSAAALQAEYQSVINRYGVNSLDFDIEGAEEEDQNGINMRDQALVGLKAANPNLVVSFTLPVLPTGLASQGENILQSAKSVGLNPNVINIMAMDYGSAVDDGGQMGTDAISAALNTISEIKSAGLTSTVGVGPLIGVNDVSSEVFTLADAQDLVNFAVGNSNITRLDMWSVARDNGSAPGINYDSPTASGIAQSTWQFSSIFKEF
jgi:chitinase